MKYAVFALVDGKTHYYTGSDFSTKKSDAQHYYSVRMAREQEHEARAALIKQFPTTRRDNPHVESV